MKDIFKYKPYKKNESFYSNLSALFLSMIIIFGPISFIFGSILFKCYAIYLDEMDVTIYAVTSLMILIMSGVLFVITYSKYNSIKKHFLKNLIKPSDDRDTYRDIYVLGTLIQLLLFVTSIYFINNNYKYKINRLKSLKTSINTNLQEKVSYTDKFKYILISDDSFNAAISINKDVNLKLKGSVFNYEIDSSANTEEIIHNLDRYMKVLFMYMKDYKYEEYYNGVNGDLREAINNYKNGSSNEVYLYKRDFSKLTRTLSVTLKGDKIIISLAYK